eukprot:1082002-Alexandrium_andersonii.AAC.1
MSASLVGSEMCIRDRRSITPAVAQVASRLALVVCAGAKAMPRSGVRRSTCLLYTSDAADDM